MVVIEHKILIKKHVPIVSIKYTITVVLLVLSGISFVVFNKSSVLIAKVAGESTIISSDTSIELQTLTQTPTVMPTMPVYGLPVRLVIPQINIDTNIINVGLTPDGSMESPESMVDVGWYEYGPRPGERGSAVIAGHQGVGAYAVFMNLYKLKVGDVFLVLDSNNKSIFFKVREIKEYNPNEHPEEVFFGSDGYHLNLITCSGNWDRTRWTMSKRLVVFSDKV